MTGEIPIPQGGNVEATYRMDLRSIILAAMLPALAASSHARSNILLGAGNIPKEKFIVYLMIGNSQMAGRDYLRSDSATSPRAWNYHWMSDKKWVPAKEIPGSMANGLSGRGCGRRGLPLVY